MLLELPPALVLEPAGVAIVVPETGDGEIEIAVAVEIARLDVRDAGDPLGEQRAG